MDPCRYPSLDPGAFYQPPASCRFTVWAPRACRVTLRLVGPVHRDVAMQPVQRGYHQAHVEGVTPGQRYLYRLDNGPDRPDPASRQQPDGVHAPSAVDDPTFAWHDADWHGLALEELVLYELHTGTFTPEGSFDAAIGQLDRLADLGCNALSLMPVAQFPGTRNWGYDGVYPFAVQASYGGTAGLKRLVDAAHRRGLAVILDVVYNHLGPEGNYLRDFGPYFSDQYKTPWGEPLNFDGPGSDEVRHYFLSNARRWLDEFHLDGLRLDAVPYIKDLSAYHVLAELADLAGHWTGALGRPFHLIGESDRNDATILRPREQGGWGLDAQWSDDFHHALHAYLTGERQGYYADHGEMEHLVRAYRDAFVLDGRYSHFRGRRYGAPAPDRPGRQFVIFAQNHDQVGNRPRGDRLGALVDFETLKLAAALLLTAPYVPMLFMGEEYGETAPFPFFVSHGDRRLLEAIRRGRHRDFAAFGGQGEPFDPADEATFHLARLRVEQAGHGRGQVLHDWYGELLRLRRALPALAVLDRGAAEARQADGQPVLLVRRWAGESEAALAFNLGSTATRVRWPLPRGAWRRILDSADGRWQGPGSQVPEGVDGEAEVGLAARSAVLLVREGSGR
jgi:maltooligosyltrehalose trehalohydrolase